MFLGEASPLYQAEVAQQTGFFWREDGGINFKDGSAFKGGMFGAAKSTINSPEEAIQYAGVTNQFFATVLRPDGTRHHLDVGASSSQVNLPNGTSPGDLGARRPAPARRHAQTRRTQGLQLPDLHRPQTQPAAAQNG